MTWSTGAAIQKIARDGLDDDWTWPGSFFIRLYTADQAEHALDSGPPPNTDPPRRKMESAAALRRQAEALLARAETIERHGQLAVDLEKMENGTVVAFTKHWGRRSPGYLYAAIKAEGRWNTTGPKSPKVYTSTEFADWLRGAKAGSGRAVDDLVVLGNRMPVASGYSTVYDAMEGSSGLYDSGEPIGGFAYPSNWKKGHPGMGGWEGEGG